MKNKELAGAIDLMVQARVFESETKRGVSTNQMRRDAEMRIETARNCLEATLAQQDRPAEYFDIEGRLVPRARLIGAEIQSGGIGDPNVVVGFLFDAKVPLVEIKWDEGRTAWIWKKQGEIAAQLYQEIRSRAFDPTRKSAA